jgi:hypothetical protein
MDKQALLAPRTDHPHGQDEDDVTVDRMGVVKVRGLSRDEVLGIQKAKTTLELERKAIALGLVDPTMTEAEVGQWQRVSRGGEMEPVIDRIRELSGLSDDAEKQAMTQFRDEPGNAAGVPPRGPAGDDGGPAAADDGAS